MWWSDGPGPAPCRPHPAGPRWVPKLGPGAGYKQKNRPFLIGNVTQGFHFYSRCLVLEKGMLA